MYRRSTMPFTGRQEQFEYRPLGVGQVVTSTFTN
jgi:hypothetical protein